MKKKFGMALVLALALTLCLSTTALAWDFNDPCLYEDVTPGDGWDGTHGYSPEDMLDNGQGNSPIWPDEGDNIYLDTYSQSGDLAHVSVGFTPFCWDEEGYWDCWEEEGHNQPDTLILDNDDFYLALGYVKTNPKWYDPIDESHYGGNSRIPDGYDIYQDDGSGEGWLGMIKGLLIGVPGPSIGPYIGADAFYFDQEPGTYYVVDQEAGELWVVTTEAGCEEVRVGIYSVEEMANNDPVGGDKLWFDGELFYFATEPRGYNAPPPYVGSGTPFDQFNGQFMVDMFHPSNAQGYKWVEGCNGKTLAEPVQQVATFSFVTYGLEIPEGTVIEGYWGARVQQFILEIIEGKFCFSPPTKFSKAVTLYELDGETWVEILRFDQVDAYGVTSLSPE